MSLLASNQRLLIQNQRFAYLLSKNTIKALTEKSQSKHGFSYCQQRAYHKLCFNSQKNTTQLRPSHTGMVCVPKSTESQPLLKPSKLICSQKSLYRCLSESTSACDPSKDPGTKEGQSVINDETFTVLAHQVLERTRSRDVRAASLQQKVVVNLMMDLYRAGYSELQAAKLLSGRLWLLQQPDAVMSIVETLRNQGFTHQLTLAFLRSLPPEYCMQEKPLSDVPEIINASLHQLRDLGFTGRNLSKLLDRSPGILLESSKTFRHIMSRLKGLFTKSDALKVASTCPLVFSQSWKETYTIFDYAFFTMGYSQPQIVQSGVFGCPLEKLQDRHAFLERVGFFFDVKKKDDPRLNPNPPLKFVVNASNGDFASEFGALSEEEYSAFLAMRDVEREEEDKGSDPDSDYDSSDSENE